jgi:penicillin amidase
MKRSIKYLSALSLIVLLAASAGAGWFYYQVRQSLPLLDGNAGIAGLTAPVDITRDALGVPTVKGENRLDIARALGFLHAQERFFQMDLLRRAAAGELAELFGPALVETDKSRRLHLFRSRARRIIENLPDDKRDLLTAYSNGVNSGIEALGQKPFEYLLLREEPAPWKPEDSILAVFAMFFDLNGRQEAIETARGMLREALPGELAEFLNPPGTEWDAPDEGPAYETPPVPGREVFDLRNRGDTMPAGGNTFGTGKPKTAIPDFEPPEAYTAGSNGWAVSGARTVHGYPILANDMHLSITVPNTWYRARLQWHTHEGESRDITGVTLPGVPAMVVGSNGHIAWGFTNSCGDWMDLILVDTSPDHPGQYLTPDGYRPFDKHVETIAVKGQRPQTYEIVSTVWGPLTNPDHSGNPVALRWIAHMDNAVDLHIMDLENAQDLEEALSIANQSGIPPQNFVCVDDRGNIGWTIIGRIPRRTGYSGRVPTSWADGSRHWNGFLDPQEYPRIVNPAAGAIWTANARIVDGEEAAKIGNGDLNLGARQKQIRDDLLKLDRAQEQDMLDVQLDSRALFLQRWRDLLLKLLNEDAVASHPDRAYFRDFVKDGWTGSASIDSAGYLLVRRFRNLAFRNVYGWLTRDCLEIDGSFRFEVLDQWEGPLWKLVTEQPFHLLDPRYSSWNQALLEVVDQTIESFGVKEGSELGDQTWGRRNTTRIQHPLSRAIPLLSRWLDMPARQLPGDSNMPRVQSPTAGASERLGVSPGHEESGYFHMPCGQSGHPLSPYYRAGHRAWEEGQPTPFLPGLTVHELRLTPPKESM